MKEFAEVFGLEPQLVARRLNSGWTEAQAIGHSPKPKKSAHNAIPFQVEGKTFGSIKEASELYGVSEANIKNRYNNLGWTAEQAVEIDPAPKKAGSRSKEIEFLGKTFPSSRVRDEQYKLPENVINRRLKRGWTESEAAGIDPPPHRHRNIDGSPRKTNLAHYEEIEGTIYPKAAIGEYKLYAITNVVNLKQYIGITTSPIDKRLTQHIYTALNSKRPAALYRAIRKYGEDKFKIELLSNEAKNYKELMQQEYEEIKKRDTIKYGYNSSVGGEIGVGKEIKIDGKLFLSHAAAADAYSIEQGKFNARLRNGWTPEQAAEIADWDGGGPKPTEVEGVEFRSIQSAAQHFNLSPQLVGQRLRSGWTPEEAMGLVKKEGLKNEDISIELNGRQFSSQTSFCKAGGFSDALVLKRRNEGWSYQKIWDEYANGGRERACLSCGALFRAMRRNKKYCSDKCKWSSRRLN